MARKYTRTQRKKHKEECKKNAALVADRLMGKKKPSLSEITLKAIQDMFLQVQRMNEQNFLAFSQQRVVIDRIKRET